MLNEEAFEETLGRNRIDAKIIDELREQFAFGSDPSELPDSDRVEFERRLRELAVDNERKPPLAEALQEQMRTVEPRLEVSGAAHQTEAEPHRLTDDQIEFFRRYGVLPPFTLETFSSDQLDRIDSLGSGLIRAKETKRGTILTSLFAWMFDVDVLDLVTRPEIIDKVASLLGEDITFVGFDGPFYLAPGSQSYTRWHAADAWHFGGSQGDTNMNLVSAWVAVSDADVERACMKIVPGSFHFFDQLFKVAPQLYGAESLDEIAASFRESRYGIEPEILRSILCRRIRSASDPRLQRLTSDGGYNVFSCGVDTAWCAGEDNLMELDAMTKVALPARRGQMYLFTSQNIHASFRNTSGLWRKAFTMRYVRSANPGIAFIQGGLPKLKQLLELFPETQRLLERLGKSMDDFAAATPRVCVRGSIPQDQGASYLDPDALREELTKLGGSLMPHGRIFPS
ncbi:MAG: phytanoyl-CoA dioxygenase family protein [Myxococcales bacterium]|nr:phytanoyl-CoA dioxygenase family protein [Myxococcales bacterium]